MARLSVSHDEFIVVSLVVTRFVVDPCDHAVNGFCNVVRIKGKVEIGDFATLIKVWFVNKVPARLVRSSVGLDVVCPGGALNERVFTFFESALRV